MTQSDASPSSGISSPADAPLPRQGWEEQYQRMAENGDDALLDGDISSMTEWDHIEWDW